ncbi:MAG: succinate dehydrogenase, cytochrome b556 subunit [Geminicoccaceae bacterium]
MAQAGRPLSPHLQIYRWYLSMALSIAHRVTGVGMVLGLVLLTWWLVALASGADYFAMVQAVMHNPLGGLILFAFTFALFLHTTTGIRHLAWDFGYGFEKGQAHQSGIVAIVAAAVLTVLLWLVVLIAG